LFRSNFCLAICCPVPLADRRVDAVAAGGLEPPTPRL
jgi:hypothetical protein